jgi:predicted AAA+ superfamily ATPase
MRYIPRIIEVKKRLRSKSHFLFGPRQTGKSTLVRQEFPEVQTYNLLESDVFLSLSRNPRLLREEVGKGTGLVVVDEIQKLPTLLDEIHLLIEEKGGRFLLTGSSARKLRRGGVNLLGGRARSLNLHPFVRRELGGEFDLLRAVNRGLLPSIYFSDDPEADLGAYAGDYLREEVAAEGLTRNVPAFSRFLEVAALCNGTILNFTNIANDAQVPRSTVKEYFQILQDTLIARTLPAWRKSKKRKPLATSKFYFFDPGVVRHLRNQGLIRERSPAFGGAFEHYLHHELGSYIDYAGKGSLAYWRSTSGFEVDFILNDSTAIEVKARETVGHRDCKGLLALREEKALKRYLLVCLARRPRVADGIEILPWPLFLDRLWDGDFD